MTAYEKLALFLETYGGARIDDTAEDGTVLYFVLFIPGSNFSLELANTIYSAGYGLAAADGGSMLRLEFARWMK